MIDMNAELIKSLIVKHLNGSLNEFEYIQLSQWLNVSDENKRLYAKIRDIDTLQRIEREQLPKRKSIYIKALSIAAMFVGLVALTVFTVNRFQGDEQELLAESNNVLLIMDNNIYNIDEKQAAQGNSLEKLMEQTVRKAPDVNNVSIIVPTGKMFDIVLEDGTHVWLNAMSEMHFPSKFNDSIRVVNVIGEAFFEVAKEKKRKFVVKTPNSQVRVLGTEFNVSSYKTDQKDVVSLVEGSVETVSKGKTKRITPGEQAIIAETEITVQPFNVDEITGWKNGLFVFDDKPLSVVLQAVARWYNLEFEFTDVNLKQEKIFISIKKTRSPEEFFEAIEVTNTVKFTRENNKIFVAAK